MIKNINRNSYGQNQYTNNTSSTNNDIKKAENNKIGKLDIKPLNNENGTNLNVSKNQGSGELLQRMKDQIKNAELIAIKIVKGEKVSSNELKFLSEKYPEIKETANESQIELKVLKEQLKNCKSGVKREKLISDEVKTIKTMSKEGVLSEVQVKVKTSMVEEAGKFSRKVRLETNKAELIAVKFVKGKNISNEEEKFIDEKYPEIKKIAHSEKKEFEHIKEQLKGCATNKEKQKILSKIMTKFKAISKNTLVSESEVNIKRSSIEELQKFAKKVKPQIDKEEVIINKIISGTNLSVEEKNLISEKNIDIKKIIEDSSKEIINVKSKLIDCKTTEERQNVIYNSINDLENLLKKGAISEFRFKTKLLALEQIKRQVEKEHRAIMFNINPYLYINFESTIENIWSVVIVIVVIIFVFF